MLVLGRKLGERIVIPDCAMIITVLDVKGDKVRLGFTAPDDIAVLREELVGRKPSYHNQADRPISE
jgi:carbon storage regulator